MTDDVTFQPPVGFSAGVSFAPPVSISPAIGFQPPVAATPDVALTHSGSFQASLGLSTPLYDYNSPSRMSESFSLLERSNSSLAALRLKMSEQFHSGTSETWRPSSDPFRTPGLVR